jgi:hypothetical protein
MDSYFLSELNERIGKLLATEMNLLRKETGISRMELVTNIKIR